LLVRRLHESVGKFAVAVTFLELGVRCYGPDRTQFTQLSIYKARNFLAHEQFISGGTLQVFFEFLQELHKNIQTTISTQNKKKTSAPKNKQFKKNKDNEQHPICDTLNGHK
jgi:hypothetical protein